MKKYFKIVCIALFLLIVLVGCTAEKAQEDSTALLDESWSDIVRISKDQTVNIYMWGGDDSINKYIDEWAAPRIKKQFGIILNRIPISDARDMVNKLLTEKQVGKENGSIDIFWINGENFKSAKENGLLWEPFVNKLPNYNAYVDKDSDDIKYDFGENTDGLEAPWGKAQFVLIYDSTKVNNPPRTMDELKEWVKVNPGKFTYPSPPDFTGSAFVRQALFETTGGYEKYMEFTSEEKFYKEAYKLWDFLNEIEPFLWRKGTTYPESAGKLDQLYSRGEVWMTMSYNSLHALNKIKQGQFPKSSKTYVLNEGTLTNTHYLSIPFNSVNKAGAMVVIDFLLSPQAQLTKYEPEYWGDGLAISTEKLSNEDKEKIKLIDRESSLLSTQELEKHRVPEISSQYIDVIEKGWMENVAK